MLISISFSFIEFNVFICYICYICYSHMKSLVRVIRTCASVTLDPIRARA